MLPPERLSLKGQVGGIRPRAGVTPPCPGPASRGSGALRVSLKWPAGGTGTQGPWLGRRQRPGRLGPPRWPRPAPARSPPPSWWLATDGPPSAGPFAHCAGEGKWAPGSCRPAMDVLAAGDRTGAAVSWRPLPRPAGARFAVEKQLGAAWHPASCRLPPPRQSVHPAVSPRTRDLEGMFAELGVWWPGRRGPLGCQAWGVLGTPACLQHGSLWGTAWFGGARRGRLPASRCLVPGAGRCGPAGVTWAAGGMGPPESSWG